MENQIQIFSNSEFGTIRTIFINGVPYFVGKDICYSLAYTNSRKALSDHVDDEDIKVLTRKQFEKMALNQDSNKTVLSLFDAEFGGTQRLILINESGLYSLIFSSHLPKAKEFKHWVTSEVLPSIRKYGYYIAPNAEMYLREFAINSVETDEDKAKVESYIPVLSFAN